MTPFKQLKFEAQLVVGKPCWAVIGPSAGSWVSLQIGEKIIRPCPVKNDFLSEEKQNFNGEYCFHFKQIGWRITKDRRCICHSNSSNLKGGPMHETFPLLEGKIVKEVSFGSSPDRLAIVLSDDFVILTRAWTTDTGDDCYTYFVRHVRNFTVYVSGRVEIQKSTAE